MRAVPAIITVAILLLTWIPGQGQRLKDWVELGDQSMENRDPYGAMLYYGNALALDSNSGSVNYKYAEALRANHRYADAAYHYAKVYERDYGNLFPEGERRLAEMMKRTSRYEEAKKLWRRVRDAHARSPESFEYQKAVQEMRAADLALRWTEEPPLFELQWAGDEINLEDSEYAGFYTDEGTLIFTSMRGDYDDQGRLLTPPDSYFSRLYVSDPDGESESRVMFPEIEAPHGNYAVAPWGDVFVTVYREGRATISRVEDGRWTTVLPRDETDTAQYTQAAPLLLDGRKSLCFSSDRPGGYGGYDLWVVTLDEENEEPRNLGPEVNSRGNEITPFFRRDENRLYFASDWHHGLGGYDIFYSEFIDGNFRPPQNLLPPFNSAANDLYYSFNETTGEGSVTSNRGAADSKRRATCCNDLWKFTETLMTVADTTPEIVTLEDLNRYLPVTLYFHNDEPDPRTVSDTTAQDYAETYHKYLALLPIYEAEYSEGLQGRVADEAEETIDRFFLDEVDGGMRDLEMFTSLLLGELEEGHRIDVSVRGYASPLARTDYNVHLANRRIVSLVNYFKKYRSGAMRPYFENRADTSGFLRIIPVPMGEYASDPLISDNPNERDAVYGIAAARERRIQIVSVSRSGLDTTLADVVFDREIIDLGKMKAGESKPFAFDFVVEGRVAWRPDSLHSFAEGEAVVDTISDAVGVQGGESGRISGVLSAGRVPGNFSATLTLYGNIPGEKRELFLTFEVEADE